MKEKIIAVIEDMLSLKKGTIQEDTKIEEIEEWDSLMHVMIIGRLEEELGISIPLEQTMDMTTVRQLLDRAGA